LVLLGRIKRIKGNKGEVVVEASPSISPFLNSSFEAELRSTKYTHIRTIESLHERGGELRCKISGVDSISAALHWIGYEIYAEARDGSGEAEESEPDLAGYEVRDGQGEFWGTVAGLDDGINPLLVIVSAATGGEILVPFVVPLVTTVDHHTRTILIDPPPGLRHLNP
jgi:ribosomal 30S subunit maturation factor RimM